MPKFIFAYHGGKRPESEAAVEKVMGEWNSWYKSMGPAVNDGGGPAGDSTTVTTRGVEKNGGANPLSGFTLVTADSHDAAVEMAKGCPMVKDGSGSVEVCEIIQM